MKDKIEDALGSAQKILIVGYSPTGGGHTARTFSIIDAAIARGHLNEGDTVVVHCPPIWEKMNRIDIDNLTYRLQSKGINVVLALADKTVYGYLDPKTGASDDSKIVQRFAMYPRMPPNTANVGDVGVLWVADGAKPVDGKTPIDSVYGNESEHTISAKSLVKTVVDIAGVDKVYLLTDMDPYLQKAAKHAQIDPTHCLDQQNHGILLQPPAVEDEPAHPAGIPQPSKAYLSKVLFSHGAISHISLGGRNSLQAVGSLATKLDINETTPRTVARMKAVKVLMGGSRADINQPFTENEAVNGRVMWANDKTTENMTDVVYVYAHKNTPAIAEHIRQRLLDLDPNYTNKLFVFCGREAAPVGYNAMHLAYLAGGHGITTAGAGTTGEFAYLHDKAFDDSRLLMLPISGHAEQQANAASIVKKFDTLASSVHDLNALGSSIDELVMGSGPYALARSAVNASAVDSSTSRPDESSTMGAFLSAVGDKTTYAEQASTLLFAPNEASLTAESVAIKSAEEGLASDPNNVIERRYAKLFFQVIDYLRKPHSDGDAAEPLSVYFKRGEPPVQFTIEQLCTLFSSEQRLREFLDPKNMTLTEWLAQVPERLAVLAPENAVVGLSSESSISTGSERSLVSRDETSTFLNRYRQLKESLIEAEAADLVEKVGRGYTTGF